MRPLFLDSVSQQIPTYGCLLTAYLLENGTGSLGEQEYPDGSHAGDAIVGNRICTPAILNLVIACLKGSALP